MFFLFLKKINVYNIKQMNKLLKYGLYDCVHC